MFYGNLLHHGLYRRFLVAPAIGHQHASGPDGRVKAVGQPLTRAALQTFRHCAHSRGKGIFRICKRGKIILQFIRLFPRSRIERHAYGVGMLFGTVGIQKRPAQVDDSRTVPVHDQTRFRLHLSYRDGLQVFGSGKLQEVIDVFRRNYHSHALLTLTDGELRSVQTLVFLRHGVQVDLEPVCQFADGNRYAARTEVVAAADHFCGCGVAEQPLKFALFRGVALLHFSAACLHGMCVVRFAGAGRPADAVAPGAST